MVYKEPGWGPNHQSHLYCCLDNTSPRPAFTSTSTSTAASGCSMPRLAVFLCCLARVHQEDRSSSTHRSTHSQDRACKCTIDFHSEVTSPLKNVLANALVTFTRKSASPLKNVLAKALSTFTRKSAHSQDHACKCTVDFHSLSSHLSRRAASAPLTFSHKSPLCTLSHSWHASLFVAQSSCSCEPDTATWCHGFCA